MASFPTAHMHIIVHLAARNPLHCRHVSALGVCGVCKALQLRQCDDGCGRCACIILSEAGQVIMPDIKMPILYQRSLNSAQEMNVMCHTQLKLALCNSTTDQLRSSSRLRFSREHNPPHHALAPQKSERAPWQRTPGYPASPLHPAPLIVVFGMMHRIRSNGWRSSRACLFKSTSLSFTYLCLMYDTFLASSVEIRYRLKARDLTCAVCYPSLSARQSIAGNRRYRFQRLSDLRNPPKCPHYLPDLRHLHRRIAPHTAALGYDCIIAAGTSRRDCTLCSLAMPQLVGG